MKKNFISSKKWTGSILDCQEEIVEKVEEFRLGSDLPKKELGSDLPKKAGVKQVVRRRINVAWFTWRESAVTLCYRRCSRMLKGSVEQW